MLEVLTTRLIEAGPERWRLRFPTLLARVAPQDTGRRGAAEAWSTFTGGLVVCGIVLVLGGIALALSRTSGRASDMSGAAAWLSGSLRRTFGIAFAGLGLILVLWGVAGTPP